MKTKWKVFMRTFFLQLSFDPIHMQSLGYLFVIWPFLKEQYNESDSIKNAQTQLSFFNTHPWVVSAILGANLHESLRTKDEKKILSIKSNTMGPFGGIGDQIAWFLILPLFTLISITLLKYPNLSIFGLIIGLSLFRILLSLVLFLKASQKGELFLMDLAQVFHKLYQGLKPLGIITLAGLISWFVQQEAHLNQLEYLIYAILFYLLLRKTKLSQAMMFGLIVLSQVILQIV